MEDSLSLFDLPADSEEAFVVYEDRLRTKFLEQTHEESGDYFEKLYVIHLAAFCEEYEFDLGVRVDTLVGLEGPQFWQRFGEIKNRARLRSIRVSLSQNRKFKRGEAPVYVLTPAQKKRINKNINDIRDLIANADLSQQKRDALCNRLNAFAVEVDRDRTRLDALTSVYVMSKRELKDFANLTEKFEKIFDLVSQAKEYLRSLPAPETPKQLPAPKKKEGLQGFSQDLDDEMPF